MTKVFNINELPVVSFKRKRLLINLKGGTCSGKTHLAMQYLFDDPDHFIVSTKIAFNVRLTVSPKFGLCFIGRYHLNDSKLVCGGCDAVKPFFKVRHLMRMALGLPYDVVYEGLLVSNGKQASIDYAQLMVERYKCLPAFVFVRREWRIAAQALSARSPRPEELRWGQREYEYGRVSGMYDYYKAQSGLLVYAVDNNKLDGTARSQFDAVLDKLRVAANVM